MTARTIEALKQEYEALNEQRIKAETEFESANKNLKTLQAQATDEFGTSDAGELKKMLKKMEAENEQQRSEYQDLLDKINGELKSVEEATSVSDSAEG